MQNINLRHVCNFGGFGYFGYFEKMIDAFTNHVQYQYKKSLWYTLYDMSQQLLFGIVLFYLIK